MTTAVHLEGPAASGPAEGPERSDFLPYLARKVGAACVSFFMLLVVGFIIFSLMPADPVSALTRGRPTSDAQMSHLRHELGLDQPLWERFFTFVGHTLTGNLGYSYEYHQSVSSLMADRIWPTLLLMGTSTLISIWLGMWLGMRPTLGKSLVVPYTLKVQDRTVQGRTLLIETDEGVATLTVSHVSGDEADKLTKSILDNVDAL